jgi:hypothetical protein
VRRWLVLVRSLRILEDFFDWSHLPGHLFSDRRFFGEECIADIVITSIVLWYVRRVYGGRRIVERSMVGLLL